MKLKIKEGLEQVRLVVGAIFWIVLTLLTIAVIFPLVVADEMRKWPKRD
jgi:hypothetical protein